MGPLASQERNIPIVGIVGVLVITKVIPVAVRRQGSGRLDWQVAVLVWRVAVLPRWRRQRVQRGTVRVDW